MSFKKRFSDWKGDLKRGLGLGSSSTSPLALPGSPRHEHFASHAKPVTETLAVPAPTLSGNDGLASHVSSTAIPHSMELLATTRSEELTEVDHSTKQGAGGSQNGTTEGRGQDKGSTPVEAIKTIAWGGLKALVNVLETSSTAFGPLQQAIGGFSKIIDTYERVAKGNDEYYVLCKQLDSLLGDLSSFLGSATNPMMTMSMKNLAIGINEEVKLVERKHERGTIKRYVEALENQEDVMESYRRIQSHLERLVLNANLSIWDIVDNQAMEGRLHQLLPAMSAAYNSAESEDVQRRPCASGTREQEIAALLTWAHSNNTGDVYWINGMAGTGKTTIAYSLCDELEKTADLGASFFCSRLIPECRNVKLIIPAIAYQLARFSHPFRHALSRVLQADPDAHTRTLKTQFMNLIATPLSEVRTALPSNIVVVIDALDECESDNSIGQILDVLLAHAGFSDLPIRFLISSRPEPEIYSRMMNWVGKTSNGRLVLHDLDASVVKRDIEKYLREELKDIPIKSEEFQLLVERSGVLFIFAATAVRFIKDGFELMEHEERLGKILGLFPSSPDGNSEGDLDVLYLTILDDAFGDARFSTSNRHQMKLILDTVLCAQEPMTVDTIAGLLKLKGAKQVETLLRPLSSVLNIAEATAIVTSLHASFPEFMFNPRRSSTFHCNPVTNHQRLVELCFDMIGSKQPQFNICALESSYIPDDNVADLPARVGNAVSQNLLYACRHWITHLELAGYSSDLKELIFGFLSKRLLLWMEVLNLTKSIHLGAKLIHRAETWTRAHSCPKETIELAHDAWKFVLMFANHPISRSTPHIYVSMLPIWPQSSPIGDLYRKHMRATIGPRGTSTTARPVSLLATWPVNQSIGSACLSPDGTTVAFTDSSSVYVVDSVTGQRTMQPLKHDAPIRSLCFSPNGELIASGSWDKDIQLWNAHNGQLVNRPLEGHLGSVLSVSFSLDGTRIVSGSTDATIRVWDVQNGRMVVGPLHTHVSWVRSVGFSLDSNFVVAGYADSVIEIWDIQYKQVVIGPLDGHTDEVRSVCFSPDGMRIASASKDSTIRLWSAQGENNSNAVITGHTDSVLSISFSPDGIRLISSSSDHTIRLWDVRGVPTPVAILELHTAPVTFTAFSSDGNRIVSCSDDSTIRVWDGRIQDLTDSSSQELDDVITSVQFSPDGTRLVTGFAMNTAKVWDASSGRVIAELIGKIPSEENDSPQVNSVGFFCEGERIFTDLDNVTIWDIPSGEVVAGPFGGHDTTVVSVDLSHHGKWIAFGYLDGRISVWSLETEQPLVDRYEAHTDLILALCFSPGDIHIVSGSADRNLQIRSAHTGELIGLLQGHTDCIRSVGFSPDGSLVVSGSDDFTIIIWSVNDGKEVIPPLKGHNDCVYSVCFSPDGSLIVSGSADNTIRVWDVHSGQTVGLPLVGHTGAVNSVVFSLDGTRAVSGSNDMTIRLWDMRGLVRTREPENQTLTLKGEATTLQSPNRFWKLNDDGWIVDSNSYLLAWVPPSLHSALLPYRNTFLISGKRFLALDFDSASLGLSWAECYDPES